MVLQVVEVWYSVQSLSVMGFTFTSWCDLIQINVFFNFQFINHDTTNDDLDKEFSGMKPNKCFLL